MKETRHRHLCLESLEPRLPLAGLVTAEVVDGDLLITGDAEHNEIDLVSHLDNGVPVPGSYEVRGQEGTSVNVPGQATLVVQGVQNDIVVNMPEGGYNVWLGANGGQQRVAVPGDFRAFVGLDEQDDKGNYLGLDRADVGGDVFVKTDPGADYNILMISYSTIAGSVAVETGKYPDVVMLFRSDVGGDFSVTGVRGAGPLPQEVSRDDLTEIYNSNVGGDVTIKNLPGSDSSSLVTGGSRITGKFAFEGGAGRNRLDLGRSEIGEVHVSTGADRDRLKVYHATLDRVFVDMGSGTDLVELFDTTVATRATVFTSRGNDMVGVMGLTVDDHFRLNTAQDRDIVFLGTNASRVPRSPSWPAAIDNWQLRAAGMGLTAGSATIVTGGGNDWFELQKSRITLDAQIFTGGGNDRLRVDRTQVDGKLRLQSGAGSDSIDLLGNQVGGQTLVLAGGGNDRLRAINNDLSGNLALYMGAGRDFLTAKFNEGAGQASLFGGSGWDTIASRKNAFGGIKVDGFEKIR